MRMCQLTITLLVLLPACATAQTAQAPPPRYVVEDSLIFERTMARARQERLDTLPIGEVIVRVGNWFVGAPYTPYTIEQPGREHLVINLREFDCVTFVENMLSFGRMIRMGRSDFATFRDQIQQLRYRKGTIDGYPSRLHYFSEWISDNTAKGLLENHTSRHGVVDPEPIDFMTTHADSYRQLADAAVLGEIGRMEKRLTAAPRYMIPQPRIAEIEQHVRNGDVIAATSSVKGLDIAHTGIAFWVNGRLHMMHAPLVGTVVQITPRPLADHIARIERQDGIMFARPIDPR